MRHRTSKTSATALVAAATLFCATPGVAQNNPYPIRSRPQPTLSKAGAPLPRPTVPNRSVNLPPGARYGSNYYYGYGRYLQSAPAYEPQAQPPRRHPPQNNELKSYGTEPGENTKPEFKNY